VNADYITPRALGVRILAVALMPALFLLTVWVYSLGSIIVLDTGKSISAVRLQNSGQTLPVRRLPGSLYLSTVRLEGEAVIQCRNGALLNLGYITTAVHVWRTVRPPDCESALQKPHRVSFL
jgi:hypothetical protein